LHPNPDLLDSIGLFHGYHDSTLLHVTSFIEVMAYFHIFHEDVRMMTFTCTLEDEALEWYETLGRKEISSLADFIEVFIKHYDPHYEEGKYEKVFEDLKTTASEETIVVEVTTSSPMEDQAHEGAPHVSIEDLYEEELLVIEHPLHPHKKLRVW